MGHAWAAEVQGVAAAHEDLSSTLAGIESSGSCGGADPSEVPLVSESAPIMSSTLQAPEDTSDGLALHLGQLSMHPAPADSNSLVRAPTEAVVGQQWADDVHAACAAQKALGESLGNATASSLTSCTDIPPPVGGAVNLERAPTEAVVGQQWADEVHAARAAQEELRSSLVAGGSCDDFTAAGSDPRVHTTSSSPGVENCPPPLARAPTEAVLGHQWAREVHAARCAQAALESQLVAEGSPAGAVPFCPNTYKHACL